MNNQIDNQVASRLARGILCAIAILGFSLVLHGTVFSVFAPNVAQAQNADPTVEMKSQWQQQYRIMLKNQAILADNAANLRLDFSKAQRRNYPRGDARAKFLIDAAQAESDLAELKKETADLLDRARSENLPRSWFSEVDDEGIQMPSPAANGQESGEQDTSREGRNPLYLD